jgi:hypothetical protein
MSKYSAVIDTFINNSLLPEINSLNLKLCSMEELGYDSPKLSSYRSRVNYLLPIYDFLNEYVKGEEEANWSDLQSIMSITGLNNLSPQSYQPRVEAVQSSVDNTSDTDPQNLISVYVDKVLYSGSTIAAGSHNITFVAPSDITSVRVNGVEQTGNVYKLISTNVSSGTIPYTVILSRGGIAVLSKTVIINAI